MAVQIADCERALCGRIVWLHNPALRTPVMCGRTIIWGLTPNGPSSWGSGHIFDPDTGTTYDLSATLESSEMIVARIYDGIALFGETKTLTKIEPRSLKGWC